MLLPLPLLLRPGPAALLLPAAEPERVEAAIAGGLPRQVRGRGPVSERVRDVPGEPPPPRGPEEACFLAGRLLALPLGLCRDFQESRLSLLEVFFELFPGAAVGQGLNAQKGQSGEGDEGGDVGGNGEGGRGGRASSLLAARRRGAREGGGRWCSRCHDRRRGRRRMRHRRQRGRDRRLCAHGPQIVMLLLLLLLLLFPRTGERK